MSDLFRDTAFGRLCRLVTNKRVFKYPDEVDPEGWRQRCIDKEKSANLAQYGQVEAPRADDSPQISTPESETSSRTRSPDDTDINQASGANIDSEKGKDVRLVTWNGDDDPGRPPKYRRSTTPKIGAHSRSVSFTFEICLLTFSVYIGSSIYTSGELSVVEIFGVGEVAATLGMSLFVVGYGLGPMIFSPMSEVPQIGRNPIYLGTLVIFVGLQVPIALAKNFGMLLAFRCLTGFFGSPILATGGASLADIWSPAKRAYAISFWAIGAICGPVLGPLVGGFAAELEPVRGGFTAPWTWPIWELMWLSGFCLVFLFFFFPETSANNILLRRTKRLRKLTGDDKLTCEPELMAADMTPRAVALMISVRPFTLNFTEPIVFALNLCIALIYGLLYIWFESFVIVFVEIYGFSLGTLGLAYMGIFVGVMIATPLYFWYLYKYVEPSFEKNGSIQPEKRLLPCMPSAFCIPACMFIVGNTAEPDIPWIVPIIGSAFFSLGGFPLFNSILNYLADAYPEYAASVLAGNDFMRSAFGAGFPLFARAMYKNLGVDWASNTLGFISVAFIPIPFVLYRYEETLRKNHSRHARKDI